MNPKTLILPNGGRKGEIRFGVLKGLLTRHDPNINKHAPIHDDKIDMTIVHDMKNKKSGQGPSMWTIKER